MNTQMKKAQQGFTLIELMIVVAIVGILAAIAIPAYQDYVARSQVSEGVATAGAVKTGITEFYQSQGEFPSANVYDDTVGGRYTASATHDNAGVITVTMRGAAPVSSGALSSSMGRGGEREREGKERARRVSFSSSPLFFLPPSLSFSLSLSRS